MSVTRSLGTFFIPLLLTGCTPAPEPAFQPAELEKRALAQEVANTLDEWLQEQLPKRHVPGAASVVVTGDRIVWEHLYGETGGAGPHPIDPDTLFCIRSISKSVTSLAVLMAVQDGLLELDRPVVDYLPGFTVHSRFDEHPERLITLRHMLSHWAGFAHDPPQDLDCTLPSCFERYIVTIPETWLRFPVGYRHEYANYGVDLAAYIIQELSGKPFAEYAEEKVLEPLGMTRSSFDLEAVRKEKNRAVGLNQKEMQVALKFPEIASAGMYASMRDMARYVQFQLNEGVVDGRRLLREDLMDEYHSIQFAHRSQRSGYCLGLFREAVGPTYCLYHEGGGRGFGAHLTVYPELDFGVVLLTNLEYHGLTGQPGRRVMNKPILERFGSAPVPEPDNTTMRIPNPGDPRIREVLGRYGDSPGTEIVFENGVPGLRTGGQLHPLSFFEDDGTLVGTYGSSHEVRFLPAYGDRPGALMTVNIRLGNHNMHYQDFNDSPADPQGPGKPEWRQYVGQYELLWDGVPYAKAAVAIRNGHLYFRDGKCEEFEPGRFFLYNGEVLDLGADRPKFGESVLKRK